LKIRGISLNRATTRLLQTSPPRISMFLRTSCSTIPGSISATAFFSRWAGSEKSFLVVRQFSTLNARIILWLQDDISLLEQQLDLIERRYSQIGGDDHDNGSFRRDHYMERKIIMEKLYVALHKYSKFLSRAFPRALRLMYSVTTDRFINEYAVLQNRPPAPKNDITSVRR
jgi:hypothetical protein